MKSYILYGLPGGLPEDYLKCFGSALGVRFITHESIYRGVYYRSAQAGQEHFMLQPNYLVRENECISEQYQEFPFLLYVNETTRADEMNRLIQAAVTSAQMLKRDDF